MGPEAELIAKIAPAFAYLIAAVLVIIFVKNYLFKGMVSAEMHEKQMQREVEFTAASQKAATQLETIAKELHALKQDLLKKVSEEIGQNTDRLKSLEFAMSDFLDQMRELNDQFEKHRKNIPETEVFLAKRKERHDQPKTD